MRTTWKLLRNKTKLTFLILFLFVTITPAHAITGTEWLDRCLSNEGELFCLGYLQGLREEKAFMDRAIETKLKFIERETNKVLETIRKNSNKEIDGQMIKSLRELSEKQRTVLKLCMPINVTLGQIQKIMKKKLNENPERLHYPMHMLYGRYMRETFPCNSQSSK